MTQISQGKFLLSNEANTRAGTSVGLTRGGTKVRYGDGTKTNSENMAPGKQGRENLMPVSGGGSQVLRGLNVNDREQYNSRNTQEGGRPRFGGMKRVRCNKCKGSSHLTKDCTLGHCVICGKKNHITNDCTWMKQMKHVPKFVGYAAIGLGVLLVQSTKETLEVENPNPMAIITLVSWEINETQLMERMHYMFNWM